MRCNHSQRVVWFVAFSIRFALRAAGFPGAMMVPLLLSPCRRRHVRGSATNGSSSGTSNSFPLGRPVCHACAAGGIPSCGNQRLVNAAGVARPGPGLGGAAAALLAEPLATAAAGFWGASTPVWRSGQPHGMAPQSQVCRRPLPSPAAAAAAAAAAAGGRCCLPAPLIRLYSAVAAAPPADS